MFGFFWTGHRKGRDNKGLQDQVRFTYYIEKNKVIETLTVWISRSGNYFCLSLHFWRRSYLNGSHSSNGRFPGSRILVCPKVKDLLRKLLPVGLLDFRTDGRARHWESSEKIKEEKSMGCVKPISLMLILGRCN